MATALINGLVESISRTITAEYARTGNECDALNAGYDRLCDLGLDSTIASVIMARSADRAGFAYL